MSAGELFIGVAGNEHYFLSITFYVSLIDAGHLAYFLQLFKGIGCVRPELVGFINKYEVIFIGIPIIVVFFVKYFVKAAVRYEFSVLVYARNL